MTNGADQAVGKDAIDRYTELRKALDALVARLKRVIPSGARSAESRNLHLGSWRTAP